MRKRLKNNVKAKTEVVSSDVPLLSKSTSENKKVLLQASRFHKGPLPLPEDLMKYNQICPGAAERIIKMAENEQKVFNKLRLKEYRNYRAGMVLGFISFIFLVCLTGWALYLGQSWVAGVLIAMVSICSVLISKKITIHKDK